jgi:hypothetical protein
MSWSGEIIGAFNQLPELKVFSFKEDTARGKTVSNGEGRYESLTMGIFSGKAADLE